MAKKLTPAQEAARQRRLDEADKKDDVRAKAKEEGERAKKSSAAQDKRIKSREKSGKPTDAAKQEQAAASAAKVGGASAIDASAAAGLGETVEQAPAPAPRTRTERNAAAARRGMERTAGRSLTPEEATSQRLLEKDLSELARKQKREAAQRDADIEGRDLSAEDRARKIAAEQTRAATVTNPLAGNEAATEHLDPDEPGGASQPWNVGERTEATAKTLGNVRLKSGGAPIFPSSGQPAARTPEEADDVRISNLIKDIKEEGSKRTVNKHTLARLKSNLSMYQDIPYGTPSVCPHAGCTNTVSWDDHAEVQDRNHPDYDAEYGSVACSDCKAKGLKSGKDLPHLQSIRKRGNPTAEDFQFFDNY